MTETGAAAVIFHTKISLSELWPLSKEVAWERFWSHISKQCLLHIKHTSILLSHLWNGRRTYILAVLRTDITYPCQQPYIGHSDAMAARCFACINLPIYTPNCAKMGVSCKFHQREEPAISTVINHLLAAGAKKGHPLRLKVELMSIAAKTNFSKAYNNDQNYLHS